MSEQLKVCDRLVSEVREYLSGLGYTESTIDGHVWLLRHLDRWLRKEGLELPDLTGSAIERFVEARRASHRTMTGGGVLKPLLTFLRSRGLIPGIVDPLPEPDSVEAVLGQWCEYLVAERGLGATTVDQYRHSARPWLASCTVAGVVDFNAMTAATVTDFVSLRFPELPSEAAKPMVPALRSLLRYLHISGKVPVLLVAAVPAVASYRDSGVRRWLRPEQITAMIEACPANEIGYRDRAVIVLLSRVGLRAGEVAALRLDDIDWKSGTILVHGKGGYIDELPLTVEAGEALCKYLNARSMTAPDRAVFQRAFAPRGGISAGAVSCLVGHAGQRAGLGAVGAHRLRHSLATATINAGASLEETAQLMRHRSLGTTTIYAKVDMVRLSAIARPWPKDPPGAALDSSMGRRGDTK